ncbi:MAG: ABC transporter permease [Halanaerobiales bacterium]|nr:ABC transporter permease [Halanaerobiales bacterium]
MNYFIKLAYKNLSRHKLRTTVSIIAIAFAVIIVIFARGFINGMVNNFYADTIQYNSGHVKIIDKDYQMEGRVLSLTETVQGDDDSNLNDIINELEEIQHVRTVAPRIKFGAITTTEGELINMIGWGVNPDKELAATDINKLITEGRMVEFGNMEIVMGSKLLDKLNKEVGDKVTLVFNNSFNSLNGATFRIVGEVTSGLTMLNEIIFYLSLDQAQRLLLMEDSSTELLIFADDRNNTEEVLPVVNSYLENNNIAGKYMSMSYKEAGGLVGWLEMAKAIYNFIYVFIVALASIVIINTMIMIVNERTKEIGMMHALGLEQRDILYLFLIEGGIMGVVGSLIGAILGGFLTNLLSGIGINFGSMTEGFSSELLFSSTIYPQFSYGNMFFGFILGTIIVTITCVIPARRAANLEPTDALREF